MPAFRHVELVADTGRHRLAIINQQMDYLGLISWDGSGYIYEPHNEPECGRRAMEAAQKILPERDREILSEEPVEVPEDFPPSWRALTSNERWARVTRLFREDPAHAYDILVTSWRAQGHQRVIETALEVLCRDDWREGFVHHPGPAGGWFDADPRWRVLAEKLTHAVGIEAAAAVSAHQLVHRDALLARAREHLRTAHGVARYAKMSSIAKRPETVASTRAWREVLAEPGAAPHALARLVETQREQPSSLEPHPRNLCEYAITALGQERHEAAIPLLTTLWEGGQRELRIRAGHALLAFAEPRAYDVLTAKLSDLEPPHLRTAIMAAFERDASSAFDRLTPHIQASELFFLAVVDVLFRDRSDALRGRASARDWFGADRRWRERLEPLARRVPKSNTADPPDEQIAALAYELVHRLTD